MGFLVAAKNPLGIHGFEDLARKEVRFINRQKGAGTRVLLDYYLKKLRIPPSEIKGYEKEVYTHLEVGISVLSKESDVGIGTIAVSKFFGLSFIPITTESFDMILDQSTFFEKGVQAFVEVLNSDGFRKRITKLGNYDFKNSGKILYSKQLGREEKMKQWIGVGLICLFLLMPCVSRAQGGKFILLSSTIGPIDSGIVDLLENEFEKETGIRVRHVGAGTGAALEIAKKGNVDLVMVHAKSLEEKFVQ